MTEDEKKQLLASFAVDDDVDDDPWTNEKLIAVAKRIIERMELDGELQ